MKLKNATIGTRVIAKALPNQVFGYGLADSEGQAGVIVAYGIDAVGMAFDSNDVIIRFDKQFNDDLWECKINSFNGEFHWGVPVEYLKLEEKQSRQ